MDCLAVVAECLLREPLRVSALLGPFRPRVTVTVQGYALDAHSPTNARELRCAVSRIHLSQMGKQRPYAWEGFQDRFDIIIEVNE
jgi:hypothetical protein